MASKPVLCSSWCPAVSTFSRLQSVYLKYRLFAHWKQIMRHLFCLHPRHSHQRLKKWRQALLSWLVIQHQPWYLPVQISGHRRTFGAPRSFNWSTLTTSQEFPWFSTSVHPILYVLPPVWQAPRHPLGHSFFKRSFLGFRVDWLLAHPNWAPFRSSFPQTFQIFLLLNWFFYRWKRQTKFTRWVCPYALWEPLSQPDRPSIWCAHRPGPL